MAPIPSQWLQRVPSPQAAFGASTAFGEPSAPETRRYSKRPTTSLQYRGTSLIRNTPPEDPIVVLCIGTHRDPGGVGISYERSTPVGISQGPIRIRLRAGVGPTHAVLIVWHSYVYLSVYLSIDRSIYLYLSIYIYLYLFNYLFISIYLYISIYL